MCSDHQRSMTIMMLLFFKRILYRSVYHCESRIYIRQSAVTTAKKQAPQNLAKVMCSGSKYHHKHKTLFLFQGGSHTDRYTHYQRQTHMFHNLLDNIQTPAEVICNGYKQPNSTWHRTSFEGILRRSVRKLLETTTYVQQSGVNAIRYYSIHGSKSR
ncbi:hypothetical protein BJV82DRAFT_606387 [Fennellomyces sp. T-0311]|nr:hypothetical protein BJV82DRAFT_606387 [Fennellomyces sp. T-0311]